MGFSAKILVYAKIRDGTDGLKYDEIMFAIVFVLSRSGLDRER